MIKPRAKVKRSKKPTPGLIQYHEVEEMNIAAWCRDLEARLPPEQVHLILQIRGNSDPFLVRFKSPDTLGFLIEELTKYRREVWPEAQPVAGERKKRKENL